MDDVVILCSADSVEWSRFILDYIGHEKFRLRISTVCDSDVDLDSPRRSPTEAKAKVIVTVVSQGHLDFLRSLGSIRRRRYEDHVIQKARTSIVLLCGIGAEETEYANAERQWQHWIPGYAMSFKFTHEQYQEMLLKTLTMVQDFDDDQLTGSTVTTTAGEGNKNRTKVREKPKVVAKGKVGKKQDWKFKIIPTTARVEEPTTMIICIDGGRQQQQQQQPPLGGGGGSIEGDSEDAIREGEGDRRRVSLVFGSNNEKLVTAERIDRNTFMFQSPEFDAGEVSIKVFLNDDVIGQTSIVYRSVEADLALAIGQVYMFLLNRVLGTVEEYGVLTQELDRSMSDLVDDEAADGGGSIPLLAFEQLFAVSAAAATDKEEKSAFDFPTLLHLAARYNLHQFGSKLTDLPYSDAASTLRSRQDLTACEMARAKGHRKMMELFETLNGNKTKINTSQTLSRKSEENAYLTAKEIDCTLEPSDDKHLTQRPPPREPQNPTHRRTEVNTSEVELSSYYESLSDYEDKPAFNSPQEVTKPSKQIASIFGKLLKKSTAQLKSKWSATSPSATNISTDLLPYFQTPLHTLSLDQSDLSPPSFIRNSVASDSSRDSCISKTSYVSGIETNDNEEDEMLNLPPLQTFATKKTSSAMHLEQLEADLRNPNRQRPPPVPPPQKGVLLHPEQRHPKPFGGAVETPSKTQATREGDQGFFFAGAEDAIRQNGRAGPAGGPSVAPKPLQKTSCSGGTFIRQQSPVVEAESNFPAAKKLLTGRSFDQGAGADISSELASLFSRRQRLQRQNHSWQE